MASLFISITLVLEHVVGKCDSFITTVYLPQASLGTHLSDQHKGHDEQLGGLCLSGLGLSGLVQDLNQKLQIHSLTC